MSQFKNISNKTLFVELVPGYQQFKRSIKPGGIFFGAPELDDIFIEELEELFFEEFGFETTLEYVSPSDIDNVDYVTGSEGSLKVQTEMQEPSRIPRPADVRRVFQRTVYRYRDSSNPCKPTQAITTRGREAI